MKILLLVTAFNSLSQAVYVRLKDEGHTLGVSYAINNEQMSKEIAEFEPELILCPFLKAFIPKEVYEKYPTYIFHPGPIGDRGPNSLEYALQSHTKEWGVVILRANELYDGGNIVASHNFKVRDSYKASIYRQEIVESFLYALDDFFEKPQERVQILNPIHTRFTKELRAIEWESDTTQAIIDKVNLSDSFPGVLDEVMGVECYLYGVWKEDKLRGKVKEVLAKRDGAI